MLPKGLVLFTAPEAAGCTLSGSRLPALEHVANRPIAHHVLDAVLASGVEEIIVAGTTAALAEARPCLNQYRPRLARIEYVICDGADLVAALGAAAPLVEDAPCLVHPADGLLAHPIAPYVNSIGTAAFDLILLGPPAELALFGTGVLQAAHELASRAHISTIGAVAECLSETGRRVHLDSAAPWRRYAGRRDELLEVNRVALDQLRPAHGEPAREGNRTEGRVQIHPSASVRYSVLLGPAAIAEGAVVTDAYVGPYTSIGAGARIEGVEIERSIVAPGAVVTHVGARIVSSLIGRGACVTRDFALPRAVRLWVGEGGEVALC